MDILHTVLKDHAITLPETILPCDKPGNPADVQKFFAQIRHCLQQIDRGPGSPYDALRDVLLILTVTLPQWRDHPQAQELFNFYLQVSARRDRIYKYTRNFGRLFGGHFKEFVPVLTDEQHHQLQTDLITIYPLGILPNLDLDEIDSSTRTKFDLDEAVKTNTIDLVPVQFGLGIRGIESFDYTVCDLAEGYFIRAAKAARRRQLLCLDQQPIVARKLRGEDTCLALRSVIDSKTNHVVLVKGGIYQLQIELDLQLAEIDLATLPAAVQLAPLRMWNPRKATDIAGDLDNPIFEDFDSVVKYFLMTRESIH